MILHYKDVSELRLRMTSDIFSLKDLKWMEHFLLEVPLFHELSRHTCYFSHTRDWKINSVYWDYSWSQALLEYDREAQARAKREHEDKRSVAHGRRALITGSSSRNTRVPGRLLRDNGVLKVTDTHLKMRWIFKINNAKSPLLLVWS